MTRAKIQQFHLARSAYVYVRQSTQHQVNHHLESKQRQYELTALVRELGWGPEKIEVIDDDLGISASGRSERTGFDRLVTNVALGRAGIVLGIEVSRLARNNQDWYKLLDLCSVRQTLIGDADGLYDPSAYNDRLLLGLKGTMSEAELHILKARMEAGLRHKASKGELQFRLVAGYEFDDAGSIVKTSDEQVAHFIGLVFEKLFEFHSVSGVLKYLLHEGLRFPRREASDGSIRWEIPYYRGVYLMLTNPIYAGTYAWGRTEVRDTLDEQGRRKKIRRRKSIDEWEVVLHGHHPGYISWAEFEQVQRILANNRPPPRDQASRALREGSALLQGIVRCGRCGRSMKIRYHGSPGGRTSSYYECAAGYTQSRAPRCQSMGGRRIDAAVSQMFLDAMAEGELEIHLAALRKLDDHDDAIVQQLELQLDRARYEAGRAERQYNAVEPENRVVARTLECRWNDALTKVAELEERLNERKKQLAKRLTSEEEQDLRRLTRDLPKLWARESTTDRDRKALLRAVIDEVQLLKEDDVVRLKVVWKGGAVTETSVNWPRRPPSSAAPPDLIALIRDLATRFTDDQIARVLVRRGIKTPKKRLTFTAHHVANLRRNHGIARFEKPPMRGDDETYTVFEAAKLLGVSSPTIYNWLRLGLLVGEQLTAQAPWAIRITPADRARLCGNAPEGWLTVKAAAAELGVTKQTILNWVKAAKIPYVYATTGQRRGLRIDVKSAPQRAQALIFDQDRNPPGTGGSV